MIVELIKIFQYEFMIKALVVGSLIGITCSFLGVFLVLKKQAMIGDGLAHVSFAAIAISLLLNAQPILVSLPIVIGSSVLILKLNEKAGIHGDAAIGLMSSFSVATGIMIASVAKGFNVDLFSYLFGSILVIKDAEVYYSIGLSILVLTVIVIYYDQLFSITYDEEFARVQGINTKFFNYLISILTSITIVLGIRVVGTMLISALIIFPTVSALQVARSFKNTIFISATISVLSVFIGIVASFMLDLPTGATIVVANAGFFILMFIVGKIIHR